MKTRALRFDGGEKKDVEEEVSDEQVFRFFLNGAFLISLSASPRDLRELAYGFCVCEGYGIPDSVEAGEDIIHLKLSSPRTEPSPVSSTQSFTSDTILSSLKLLSDPSQEWIRTGGTHLAAVFSANGDKLCSFEDVGRRNALDKAVGWAALNSVSLEDKFLLFSGRLSGDVVERIAKANIPLIVSNAAPLSLGIEKARLLNVSVAAFARKNRFTVYSGFERIV